MDLRALRRQGARGRNADWARPCNGGSRYQGTGFSPGEPGQAFERGCGRLERGSAAHRKTFCAVWIAFAGWVEGRGERTRPAVRGSIQEIGPQFKFAIKTRRRSRAFLLAGIIITEFDTSVSARDRDENAGTKKLLEGQLLRDPQVSVQRTDANLGHQCTAT